MLKVLSSYLNDFSHLLFPHYCEGCGTAILQDDDLLCAKCLHQLPYTAFINAAGNPVEKIFLGRVEITAAAAAFYFTKDSLIQHLMIGLKYRNNKNVGLFLGKLMGYELQKSERFNDVDILVPLPLNPKKERERGYNQAAVICEGIASAFQKPVVKNAVARTQFTETQTTQNRIHRWQNMEGVFSVTEEQAIKDKHILLVDDVITTGATLEACGSVLKKVKGTKISIATVAYTI